MSWQKRLISSVSERTTSVKVPSRSTARTQSWIRSFDPHHPAILRMIQMVVENAHKAGIWAGICGELGADQELTKEFPLRWA